MSIRFGDHFEKFLARQKSSGKYRSTSEVIRSALALLEARQAKIDELNTALLQGEESGFILKFNAKDHLRQMKKR